MNDLAVFKVVKEELQWWSSFFAEKGIIGAELQSLVMRLTNYIMSTSPSERDIENFILSKIRITNIQADRMAINVMAAAIRMKMPLFL